MRVRERKDNKPSDWESINLGRRGGARCTEVFLKRHSMCVRHVLERELRERERERERESIRKRDILRVTRVLREEGIEIDLELDIRTIHNIHR